MHRVILLFLIFFMSHIEALASLTEMEDISVHAIPSASLNIEDEPYAEENNIPNYLTNNEAIAEAKRQYQEAKILEGIGDIKEAQDLYDESARKGYALSKLRLKEMTFDYYEREIEAKEAFLHKKENDFNHETGVGEKLGVLSSIEWELVQLNEDLAHAENAIGRLQSSINQGTEFYYDMEFYDANNICWLTLNDKKASSSHNNSSKNEDRRELLKNNLKKNIIFKKEKLEEILELLLKLELKTAVGISCRNEIIQNDKVKFYFIKLNKLASGLADQGGSEKSAEWYERAKDYLMDQGGILKNELLGILKRYISGEYILSMVIFNELQKIRDFLLTRLGYFIPYSEGDSLLLINFSNYFMQAHDNICFPDPHECLRAKLITLREAERYLVGLREPEKYVQLTNPERYRRIKTDPQQQSKKSLFNEEFNRDPSFDPESDIFRMISESNVRNRAIRYTLWLLEKSYRDIPSAPSNLYALQKKTIGLRKAFEVSPWAYLLTYFFNMKNGETYNFIFDVASTSLYIASVPNDVIGHPDISRITPTTQPCGGSIKRVKNNLFRTNEASGHYGCYWNDERRYIFLQTMSALSKRFKNFQVLHEPWLTDEDRVEKNPGLLPKIREFEEIHSDEKPKQDLKFQKLTTEELLRYQAHFLVKMQIKLSLRNIIIEL